MKPTKSFTITIIVILLLTLISMGFKIKPTLETYDDLLSKNHFKISYKYYAKSKDKKLFIKTYLPENNEHQKIYNKKESSNKLIFKSIKDGENLRGIWRAKEKDLFHKVNYSFNFNGKAVKYDIDKNITLNDLETSEYLYYLKEEKYIEVNHPEIQTLAKNLTGKEESVNNILTNFYNFTYHIPKAPIKDLTSALKAYQQNKASCNGKARLFVALCRSKGIAARLKGGLILKESKKRTSHLWAEVLINNKWIPFDVLNGHFAYLPSYFLELYTGDEFLITHTPNIVFDYTYEIKKLDQNSLSEINEKSLLSNNPTTLIGILKNNIVPKQVLSFLLLLPLGGLLIAILKNVFGLKTYGVFLPILIAYTFTSVGFFVGLLLFLTIVTIVGLITIPLNNWGLLYTPKLVVVLSSTVLIMFALISLGIHYKIEWLLSLTFFPIIITTLVSERFARGIEEDGFNKAINTLLQTLLATVICYVVFESILIKTFLLIFPELILLMIITTLLLGKWIGLRVSEYLRFNYLIKRNLP